MDKKTNVEEGCTGPLVHNDSATHFTHEMDNNGPLRDGALTVESRWAGGVPGPMPQRGPTPATSGHPIPMRCMDQVLDRPVRSVPLPDLQYDRRASTAGGVSTT